MHHTTTTTRPRARFGARGGRRGAMLVEMLVAGILLTTVVMLVGPLLLQSNHVRRTAAQRQLATQVAENCLERLVAGETPELARANVARGWDTQKWLPEMTLDIAIRADDARRQATVSVSWTAPPRQAARAVRLTGWLPAPMEDSR
jgi:Tfp pilus assembly protein PilV